jgi:signal transduction histidine kinase
LEADEDEIEVVVSDDGSGFEPGRAGAGVGLTSMKERATLIGGDLEIRSKYLEGTRVCFRVPRTA